MELNKHRRVPVMGIEIDSISVPRAVELSQEYLDNDHLNFVLLAGAKTALLSMDSKEIISFSTEADLILPGDHNIEKAAGQELAGDYLLQYLDGLLRTMARGGRQICVIGESEDMCEYIRSRLLEEYEDLSIRMVAFKGSQEQDMEAVVNKINGFFPDLILPLIPMEDQIALYMGHKSMISAKLFISSRTLTENVLKDGSEAKGQVPVVSWLKSKLKIGQEGIDSEFWQQFEGTNRQNDE